MGSGLLRWAAGTGQGQQLPPTLTPQGQQKVELLRKAVQAHRAYTDRVSKPLLSLLA